MTRKLISHTTLIISLIFVSVFFLAALPNIASAATASVTVTPSSVLVGEKITIRWSSAGAFRCVGRYFGTGGATSGTKVITATGSGVKTYSVACYDESPRCSLNLKSSRVVDSSGQNTCTGSRRVIQYSPNGSCYLKNATCRTSTQLSAGRFGEPGTYQISTFRCEGGCSTATASDSVTVNTPPPPPNPSVTLSASPSTVTSGNSTLISWSSARATSCRGSGFSTNGATSGSVSVTPTGDTNYRITCDSEVLGSAPGTWQYAFTDFTDLWCPISNSVFNQTWLGAGDQICPTSNVTVNNGNGLTPTRTNTGDPTGLACSGGETCILNSNNSCVIVTKVYRCNGGSAPIQISDSVSVSSNGVPNTPVITGPTSGVEDTSYTFTFKASDPDNNNVRYRIDWNPSTSIDQNSSYGSSNWLYSTTHSWSSPGVYSFRAQTQDSGNAQSGYTTHTITISSAVVIPQCSDGIDNDGDGKVDLADFGCTAGGDGTEAPNPQCSDGIDNDGDGRVDLADYGCTAGGDTGESPNPQCSDGIDNNGNGKIDYPADPACTSLTDNNEEVLPDASISITPSSTLVQKNNSVVLDWTSENATNCSLSGTNGDSWSLSGTSGSKTSSALVNETIFVLACTDLNDDLVSISATIKIAPAFTEQ